MAYDMAYGMAYGMASRSICRSSVAGASVLVDANKVTKMIFSKATLSYKWVIKYAEAVLKSLADGELKSPSFTVSLPCEEDNSTQISSWYLYIPKKPETEMFLPLYLCQNSSQNWTDDSRVLIMDCSFSVLNSKSESIHTFKVPAGEFELGKHCNIYAPLLRCGTDKFMHYKCLRRSSKRSSYHVDVSKYSVGDTLTISINASLLCLHGSVKKEATPIPTDNIRQQVEIFRDDDTFSDITIECGSEVFKVHRIILASQSPVFKKMFEVDMKEKQDGVITISDIDAEVVSDMLTFIYTGSAPNLKVLVKELLNVANKYELPRLMVMCKDELEKQINIDDVIEILQLADLHGVKELKKECMEFIKVNSTKVHKTTEWEDFKGNEDSRALYMDILEYMCHMD